MNLALGRHSDVVDKRVRSLVGAGAADAILQRDARFWGIDNVASVSDRLGWLDIASGMRERLPELQGFARELLEAGVEDVVLLGMGGSSLAPEVLRQTVGRDERYPRLHVLDSTDPATILALQRGVRLPRTLFIVASKSGGTIEPVSLFRYFYEAVDGDRDGSPGSQFVAITDPGTSLARLAGDLGFRRVFLNPPDIGGRYSALSFFGLVPAAATGIDIERLLDRAMRRELALAAGDNDALVLGAALGELARVGRDKCTFLIQPAIAAFGLWLEQLIAESTGKDGTGILPVVGEPLGTPHRYGPDRWFVHVSIDGGDGGNQQALAGALRAEGFPVVSLDLDDAHDLGAEFLRWEYATAVAGQVLGINPFDEPNVQESKDNTARVLSELDASGHAELAAPPDHAVRPGVFQREMETFLHDLRSGMYLGITAYVTQTSEMNAVFNGIREVVRDELGLATTLGYGPRFLHSTGQLHKGGPATGAFIQVVADDAEDIAIPGEPYTFGQLKQAQALGDYQSLLAHGRPVLRAHLGTDAIAGARRLRDGIRGALAASTTRR